MRRRFPALSRTPRGAVIAGARVEITSADLAQPVVLDSDGLGKFASPGLKPGTYSVRVTRDGFEPLTRTVELKEAVQLQLQLAIAQQQVSISVPGKSLAFANSDPVYRQLRGIGLGPTFRLENFTLIWDVGKFQFQKGTLTFLNPVDGVVTGAVFIGEGRFSLKAVLPLDAHELERRTGEAEVNEDFTEAVFRFNGPARMNFLKGLGERVEPVAEAANVFSHWKERLRHRREYALGFTQGLLEGETMDNVDADLLAAAYNPSHPDFFNAYIRGKKHKDLRFFVRSRVGAVPQLDSPEEVALINCNSEGMDDGVWYLDGWPTQARGWLEWGCSRVRGLVPTDKLHCRHGGWPTPSTSLTLVAPPSAVFRSVGIRPPTSLSVFKHPNHRFTDSLFQPFAKHAKGATIVEHRTP